jgi:hypothetical protein
MNKTGGQKSRDRAPLSSVADPNLYPNPHVLLDLNEYFYLNLDLVDSFGFVYRIGTVTLLG